MTVENQLPPTTTAGDGSTVTFPYNFKIQDVADLDVTQTIVATGEDTTLEIVSSTGIGDPAGGTVTFASAPPAGSVVSVDNKAPISQPQEFDGNDIYPKSVEDGLDRKTIENQRQQSEINRTLRLHVTDSEAVSLPHKSIRADSLVGFDATGENITMVKGAAASQAYVDLAEAQADRAVAAATYPYTSGEQKTGAFMPGTGESLTLFTYNNASDAAVTLPALSGLASTYNIGICRTAGSGDQTISAADGALINGAASIVHASDYLCLDFTVNEAGDEWVAVDKALIGLPVGTAANNILAVGPDGKLPEVDGSKLLRVRDDTARDISLTTFLRTETLASDPLASYGDIISNNFQSDNLSVSTGATYDSDGDYYHNEPGVGVDRASGVTPTSNIGTQAGTLANITDGNTVNGWQGNRSTVLAGDYIEFDLGASYALSLVKYYTSAGSDTFAAINILGSDTGAFAGEESVLGSATLTNTTGYQDINVSGTARYVRIESDDGSVTSANNALDPTIFEIQIFDVAAVSDMTLQSAAVTLTDADPSDVTALFRVEDIDTVTDGTDRVISFSIDNGSTFSNAAISFLGPYGEEDTLIKARASVEAQSGSQLVIKLVTANGKAQRIKQYAAIPEY